MAAPVQRQKAQLNTKKSSNNVAYLFVHHYSSDGIRTLSNREVASHAQKYSSRVRLRPLRQKKSIASAASNLVGWQVKDDTDVVSPPDFTLSSSSSSSHTSSRLATPEDGTPEDTSVLDPEDEEADPESQAPAVLEGEIYTFEDRSPDDWALLRPAINALVGSVLPIDNSKHKVILYVSNAWLPSNQNMPKNCHIWGFAPVRAEDRALSTNIISTALQTSDQLHLFSLLAVSSSRMRWLSQHKIEGPLAPENFVIKSIRALRGFLDSGQPPNDRILMDLAFLTLTEFFAGSKRSNVYWQMIKTFVVACGGFGKLSPFVSHILIATDWKVAAANVSPPTFDVYSCPGLLGLEVPPDIGRQALHELITDALKTLDPRVMIRIKNVISLNEIVQAICALPSPHPFQICQHVQQYQALVYRYCATCLRPRETRSNNPKSSPQVVSADLLDQRTKSLAFRLWLWQVALAFLDSAALYTATQKATQQLSDDCSQTMKCLTYADNLLSVSDWRLDPETTLWKLVLVLAAPVESKDKRGTVLLLRKIATELKISTREDLELALSGQLPLELVQGYDADEIVKLIAEPSVIEVLEVLEAQNDKNQDRGMEHLLHFQFSEVEHQVLKNMPRSKSDKMKFERRRTMFDVEDLINFISTLGGNRENLRMA